MLGAWEEDARRRIQHHLQNAEEHHGSTLALRTRKLEDQLEMHLGGKVRWVLSLPSKRSCD